MGGFGEWYRVHALSIVAAPKEHTWQLSWSERSGLMRPLPSNCYSLKAVGQRPHQDTSCSRLMGGTSTATDWEPSVVEIVRRQFSPGVAGSACMAYLMAACLAGRSSPTSQRSPRNRAHFFQLCVSSSHLFHFSFLLHAPLPTAHFPIETNR